MYLWKTTKVSHSALEVVDDIVHSETVGSKCRTSVEFRFVAVARRPQRVKTGHHCKVKPAVKSCGRVPDGLIKHRAKIGTKKDDQTKNDPDQMHFDPNQKKIEEEEHGSDHSSPMLRSNSKFSTDTDLLDLGNKEKPTEEEIKEAQEKYQAALNGIIMGGEEVTEDEEVCPTAETSDGEP